MTGRRIVDWKTLRRACRAKGLNVEHRGSEAKIWRLNDDGTKTVHILQHKCCGSPNAVVWTDHLKAIQRKFGLADADFD
jgi:hypothetical protein